MAQRARTRWWVAGVLMTLALGGVARAAVVLPLTVEELARRADAVVRGVAGETRPIRSADGRQIHTVTTIEVDLALKGGPPLTLEVLTPGGTWGDLSQTVTGAPSFRQGERVILFLRSLGPRRFRVEGLALGKFEVVTDAQGDCQVVRRTEGIQLAEPDGAIRPAPQIGPIPERDFLNQVRAALTLRAP